MIDFNTYEVVALVVAAMIITVVIDGIARREK